MREQEFSTPKHILLEESIKHLGNKIDNLERLILRLDGTNEESQPQSGEFPIPENRDNSGIVGALNSLPQTIHRLSARIDKITEGLQQAFFMSGDEK